jgi:hypothetical protein
MVVNKSYVYNILLNDEIYFILAVSPENHVKNMIFKSDLMS